MTRSNYSNNYTTWTFRTTAGFETQLGGCVHSHLKAPGMFANFVIAIGIILLCENLLLISVIARNRSLHTNTNILVASLAITDVLLGVLAPLTTFLLNNTVETTLFPKSVTPAMYLVLASNSGMNFLIITYMNKDFRAALVQTIPCCRLVCRSSPQ